MYQHALLIALWTNAIEKSYFCLIVLSSEENEENVSRE